MMKKLTSFLLTTILFSTSGVVLAQDEHKTCIDNLGLGPKTIHPRLTAFEAASLRVAEHTRKAIAEDPARAFTDKIFMMGANADQPLIELSNIYAEYFPEKHFSSANLGLAKWQQYRITDEIRSDSLNLISATATPKQLTLKTNDGTQVNRYKIKNLPDDVKLHCQNKGFSNCHDMFREMGRIGAIQNCYIKTWNSDRVAKNIYQTAERWQQFSAESRYQTPIDIWFTSFIYRDQLKNLEKLPEPPDYQLFLARPSIVIDHFDKARKGDKTEYSLSVEWLGFNRWQSSIPWGASITSVYSDRIDGQSVGHGLTLHLYNNFSIGVVDRGDGDKSVFVSLELMDWFGQAQQKYQAYKKRYFN